MTRKIAWLLGACLLAACGTTQTTTAGGGGGSIVPSAVPTRPLPSLPGALPTLTPRTAPTLVPPTRPTAAPTTMVPTPRPAPSFNVQMSPVQFLQFLAQANQAEITDGHLALQNSANSAVKQFAQTMITDHTNASALIQRAANADGVSLPGALSTAQQQTQSQLANLNGVSFDRAYVAGIVPEHVQVLGALYAQANSTDANVRNLANQLLPTIKDHLAMAERLASQINPATPVRFSP